MDTRPDRQPRRLPTALAGAALGIGGLTGSLFLLGQTAGAEVGAESTVTPAAQVVDADVVGHVGPDGDDWAAFDGCLVDHGVLSEEELEQMYAEADAWEIDGEEFDEEFAEEWEDVLPNVAIENGDELTFVDFGDGDGTVTISKVGDDITVTSDGDVMQETINLDEFFDEEFDGEEFDEEFIDGEEFDAELEAEFEAWDAAIDACEDLAPEGAFEFEDGEFEEGELDEGDYENED